MDHGFTLTVTRDPEDVRAARRLRHTVFVDEMGADPGPEGLEGDAFDAVADHLILRDGARPEAGVVATMRMARGGAYTGQEFDLATLRASGRTFGELGRTCLHPAYRGGLAGLMLLQGMLGHARAAGFEIVLGTASFPGADAARHIPALRRLAMVAGAPADLCPRAHGPGAIRVQGEAPADAMRAVPPLIKTYLRAGAWVGDGAYLDRAFNTVDVCMVLDLARLRLPRRRAA